MLQCEGTFQTDMTTFISLSRVSKSIETGSWLVIVTGWEKVEMGSDF